jgi:hypothetical protein
VNNNAPISIQFNLPEVRRALEGGSTPLQTLNRQYVATQLSNIAANDLGLVPATSPLRCFGVNFTPVTLSNGVMLWRNTTFGELLSQTRTAILRNRTDDMLKLAMVLALLNGDDPNDRCR